MVFLVGIILSSLCEVLRTVVPGLFSCDEHGRLIVGKQIRRTIIHRDGLPQIFIAPSATAKRNRLDPHLRRSLTIVGGVTNHHQLLWTVATPFDSHVYHIPIWLRLARLFRRGGVCKQGGCMWTKQGKYSLQFFWLRRRRDDQCQSLLPHAFQQF